MSWVVEKHKILNSYLLDLDEMNDLLSVYADEAMNLNEHNWTDTTMKLIVVANKAAPDFCLTVAHTRRERSHRTPASGREIVQSTSWVFVGATAVTWDSGGGKALVILTGQLHVGVLGSVLYNGQTGLNFAIELDGVVHTEALIGTGDPANDYIDSGTGVLPTGGTSTGFTLGLGSSPSFYSAHPFVAKAVLNVSPGRHQVRLVARNLQMATASYQFITNYEGIVLDMWA